MIQNDKALLLRLQQHQVEFVIIGGVCGIMHGVTLVTADLDICCRFDRDNLYRIQASVRDLHPVHRLAANKLPLELSDELCSRLRNLYVQTDCGKLDCLSEVAGLGDYEAVLRNSEAVEMSYGKFRMLTLDAIIAAKEAVGRERDLAAVRQLRAIKERLQGPKL
jgi:predicted nucleotidyltransferase